MNTVLSVGIYSLLTAIATGVGALPFFFTKKLSRQWLSVGNAAAAGFMIGASFLLLQNGFHFSAEKVLVGIAVGVLFIVLTELWLRKGPQVALADFGRADARKMLLIVIVMTVHSFSEGVGIGVAFGNGAAFGILIALAMAIHNIPEGLAISLVLCPRGVPAWKAVGWSIFSSLPQLLAIPAYIFVEHFHPFLPVGLGFAAGAMLWMVFSELIPEALREGQRNPVWLSLIGSAFVMILLERAL